jgi:hypothetical protein
MFRKGNKIRLIFKSGRVEDVRVDKLEVERRNGRSELIGMTWTNMRPRPLYLDVSELVAVFELDYQ